MRRNFFINKRRSRFDRIKNVFKNGKLKRPDYYLVAAVFTITIFGLIMLASASSIQSYQQFGKTYYLFWHQFIRGFLPGLALFIFFSKYDYRKLERFSVSFFIASIIILILVFIPGIGDSHDKARSWINIFGLTFQPSEIVKLLLILSLAGWFSYRGKEATKDFWNGLVPFIAILGVISGLIILQPDIGTLAAIIAIALSIFFVAQAKIIHIFGIFILGLGSLGILILQAPYRAARLTTFLQPEFDPQGIGYHINNAFLAIGSGGWFGLGFGQSRQKFAYLPEVIGDSIFAVIAEELGFIVSASLVILFLFLAWRGLKLTNNADNDYAKFITVGITCWIIFQAFFNIAAMVGLMPLTGIPLPFVSYGGTALATLLASAGILTNISRQT